MIKTIENFKNLKCKKNNLTIIFILVYDGMIGMIVIILTIEINCNVKFIMVILKQYRLGLIYDGND